MIIAMVMESRQLKDMRTLVKLYTKQIRPFIMLFVIGEMHKSQIGHMRSQTVGEHLLTYQYTSQNSQTIHFSK